MMRKVRGRDTKPELLLRKALWRAGLRYRVNDPTLPGTPDIVFPRRKLAVFVDGEFWHGKKLSAERLAEMPQYWRAKISRNVERDQRVNHSLQAGGWRVLRIGTQTIAKHLNELVRVISDVLEGRDPLLLPDGTEFLDTRRPNRRARRNAANAASLREAPLQ